ncbi:hypothetical protein [Tenggerimyces flavus]|uniref:Uncharacterized protein n=1 Tax=Tenggerimyces flavus TaxID=1708749 RepID=A0ABV7YIQ5_9ACTN|nr:hypothetical protein [Tenggerimyces flavus]MBM7789811.1 hypothetical protein [Tenggerimyces flavus]
MSSSKQAGTPSGPPMEKEELLTRPDAVFPIVVDPGVTRLRWRSCQSAVVDMMLAGPGKDATCPAFTAARFWKT